MKSIVATDKLRSCPSPTHMVCASDSVRAAQTEQQLDPTLT